MPVVIRRVVAAVVVFTAACSHESRPRLNNAPTDVSDTRIGDRSEVSQAGRSDGSPSIKYVSDADLDRRTAQLFGDTGRAVMLHLPVDSMLPAGDDEPTWDIEVRSYEMVD